MPEALYIISDVESPAGSVRVLELRLPVQIDIITFDDLNLALTNEFATPVSSSAPLSGFIIDMSRTSYVGSAVLGLLVNLRSHARRNGGRLVLCGLSQRILEVFRVGSLESLFTIAPTKDDALRILSR